MTWLTFFQNFLKNPSIGAILPSSRYISQYIEKSLPKDLNMVIGKLYAIELNHAFAQELKNIKDSRFSIFEGDIARTLNDKNFPSHSFDAIISGIPFSFIKKDVREEIIKKTADLLNTKGIFLVYQTSFLVLPLLKKYFSTVEKGVELKNLPPYFIMIAKK